MIKLDLTLRTCMKKGKILLRYQREGDFMYPIIKKEVLNPSVTKMVVYAPLIAKKAKPGQFIILRVHERGERFPLTIADYDREEGTITIIFQIVGKATILLNELSIGDEILNFVGPLGKATDIDGKKKVCVIAGGVGSAIAYPVAKGLHDNGCEVTSIAGFRSNDLVILKDEFENVSESFYLVSDDGSTGHKGLVTDILKELIEKGEVFDEVIAIGPLIMMKFVCLLTKQFNIKTMVSMNPIMIDGTGMCGGCRLSVGGKTKFACVDGPDFDGHLVDFDEAMSRASMYREDEEVARDQACVLMKGGQA